MGTATSTVDVLACNEGPLPRPLALSDVVSRALCFDPRTQTAWLNARLAASQLGVAYAALLPQLDATVGGTHSGSATHEGKLRSQGDSQRLDQGIELSYLLFDDGARKANAKQYELLLDAARHDRNGIIQNVIVDACSAYYQAQAAADLLQASQVARTVARNSLHAIQARYVAGVATQADRLQASVAFSESELAVVAAEGQLSVAKGELAHAMGQQPDLDLDMRAAESFVPNDEYTSRMTAWMDEALRSNPAIQTAKAQLAAARFGAASIEASGMPTVTLQINRSAYQLRQGMPGLNSSGQAYTIGWTLNIPLLDHVSRAYQIAQARLGIDLASARLESARQDTALSLWTNYQYLSQYSTSLRLITQLQEHAHNAYTVAQGRYQAGVGDVMQLLMAQSDLAAADINRINTALNWRIAQLRMMSYLGQMDLDSLSAMKTETSAP